MGNGREDEQEESQDPAGSIGVGPLAGSAQADADGAKSKVRAAAESVTPYGWSLFVVVVAIGLMFELNAFSPSLPSLCTSSGTFVCGEPVLYGNGTLSTIVSDPGSSITVTGVGCSSGGSAPASFEALPRNVTLSPKGAAMLQFGCKDVLGSSGSRFSGELWVKYDTATQTGLSAQVGRFMATEVAAPQAAALSGPDSGSGT